MLGGLQKLSVDLSPSLIVPEMAAQILEQQIFRISAKTLLQYCSVFPVLAVGQGQRQGC